MSVHDRIVTKSSELFFHYGINSISTDNISGELGISKRTFYQHFESKEQLVEVIVSDEIDQARRNLRKLKMCGFNAVVEAIKICELDLKYKRLRSINYLRDIQKSYPAIWDQYEAFKEKYIENVLIENIRCGILERYYWPDLNEKTTAGLWLEISYLNYAEQQAGESVRQHFIRGLLNPRGISEYLFWQ